MMSEKTENPTDKAAETNAAPEAAPSVEAPAPEAAPGAAPPEEADRLAALG